MERANERPLARAKAAMTTLATSLNEAPQAAKEKWRRGWDSNPR
jgi:hypothetical protein